MTERELSEAVVHLAKLGGWWLFHPHDSTRSTPGWPDLVLLRPPSALFVELKTDQGRLRAEQVEVLERLSKCGLDVRVWRPCDLDRVAALLAGPRSPSKGLDDVGRYVAPRPRVEDGRRPRTRRSGLSWSPSGMRSGPG